LILEISEDLVEKEAKPLKNIFEKVLIRRLANPAFKDLFIKTELEIKNVPLVADIKVGHSLYDLR